MTKKVPPNADELFSLFDKSEHYLYTIKVCLWICILSAFPFVYAIATNKPALGIPFSILCTTCFIVMCWRVIQEVYTDRTIKRITNDVLKNMENGICEAMNGDRREPTIRSNTFVL